MKKIFFIVLALFFVAHFLRASNTYHLFLDDLKPHSFNTISLNNIEYLDLLLIKNYFFNKSKVNFNKFEITAENYKICFIPESNFILFTTGNKNKVFQMRQPAKLLNNSLLIPFNSLLIALEVFNIYKVDCDIDKILIERFIKSFPDEPISAQKDVQEKELSSNEIDLNDRTFIDDFADNVNDSIIEKNKSSRTQNKPLIAKVNNENLYDDAINSSKPEPNVYKLPPNLKRGDLTKDYTNIQLADSKNDSKYALSTSDIEAKLQIIKIEIENKSEYTEIRLFSNSVIENYQKPDCDGKNMKIRIPGASDKIPDISKFNDFYPLNKISAEIVKNLLIYTVSFSVNIINCTSKRNGPKELIFTVHHSPIKTSVDDKSSSDLKKNDMPDLNSKKKKWELDVIVLDPGHGGHDVGAVGVSGIFEKDLTLKLAKKVKELLSEKMPNTKVVLTRDDDRFIELFKRGQIANQVGGKLFISIHLNAAQKKPSPARGVETYILRPGRNDDAIRVANFENSVIKFEKKQDLYKHLNEEQIIIATMAQSAFVQFSEKLAKHVQEEVVATTNLDDRGVKQAGFYVLVGASMPNILFEACFLSNPEDEKFVNSADGQEKIAKGLVRAIKKYSDEYMK